MTDFTIPTPPEPTGTPTFDPTDPLSVGAAMVNGMAALGAEFRGFRQSVTDELITSKRKARRQFWVVVFDITASVVFFVASILFIQSRQHSDAAGRKADRATATATATASTASALAAAQHAAAVASCLSGNDFRAADAARWTNLMAAAPQPATSQALAIQRSTLALILAPDVPRDCAALK